MDIAKDYLKLSKPIIELAIKEDLKNGDVTTKALIPSEMKCKAKITAKANGIVCGLEVAKYVFETIEAEKIEWAEYKKDGEEVKKGEIIVELISSYKTILSAERIALNFLQRMSGVATSTNKFVKKLSGTNTKLLDTRKTMPGLRYLDKYSVLMGGATNHRFGLYDMIMLKENHIKVAGSISNAVNEVRKKNKNKFKIEVETTNFKEVQEALQAKADIIMLDNMSIVKMKKCVDFVNGRAKLEASGNVNLTNIKAIANTGVDFISVGAITHSVTALDISLLIQ